MASTIRIKRSSVSGKQPNTTNLSTGELALNLSDGRLFSSDGSSIFEVGANVASLTINGAVTLPTSAGSNNQIMTTDGSGNVTFRTNAPTFISSTAPSNPVHGQIWMDLTDETTYIYLEQAGNSRWITVTGAEDSGGGGGGSGGITQRQSILHSLMFG
jgi:hypothetical protein